MKKMFYDVPFKNEQNFNIFLHRNIVVEVLKWLLNKFVCTGFKIF